MLPPSQELEMCMFFPLPNVTFHCIMIWVQLPFYISPRKAQLLGKDPDAGKD